MQKFYIKYREREKIFQIQAESEQDAIIIAKQLITSKYLLSPESDLTLCVLYTWNEIYERAIDSCCMSPELRAKDEARNQVREFALEKGFEDLEKQKFQRKWSSIIVIILISDLIFVEILNFLKKEKRKIQIEIGF